MADLSDVMTTLGQVIQGALYPNGTSQPSVAGCACKIFSGWPAPQQLDDDLLAGTVNVSIYPRQDEQNVSRYTLDWLTGTANTATITLTQNGQQITVGGTIPAQNNPQNASLLVNGKPYIYPIQQSDTLATIATALASLVAADVSGTSSNGAVITIGGLGLIEAARVGVTGSALQEVRRQNRLFQITIWAPNPTLRDAVTQPIDLLLAQLPFLTLPDGFAARMLYKGSPMNDMLQKARLYRRDLLYTVEYATTRSDTLTQITNTQQNTSFGPDGTTVVSGTNTIYN